MAPPTPATHSKKGGKGVKLTPSFSSARLRGDGDSIKPCLPKSITVADICHPHMSQYASFQPIDGATAPDYGRDVAGDTRALQSEKAQSREPGNPLQGEVRAICEDAPAQEPGRDAIARLPPITLPQYLPYSKTSDFESLSLRHTPLPRSTTTVLPPLRLQHRPQISSKAADYDPDEINRKVSAMLAATEALKPKSPTQSTRKQTAKNRVFSKVVGLFGRLRSNRLGNGSEKRVYDIKSLVEPKSTKFRPPSSTGPLYMLSEKTESRAWTLQERIEPRIPRKPLPKDRLNLQPPCLEVGEPVSTFEAMGGKTLGSSGVEKEAEVGNFIKERKRKEVDDCGGLRSRIGDSFGSEQSFDNLEGFLTTQPVGASTPKRTSSYNRDRAVANNDNGRSPPPIRLSHHSANDADDELTDEDSQAGVSKNKRGNGLVKPPFRLQRSSRSVRMGVNAIEPQRLKTYPSPSKASLEEPSRQLEVLLPHSISQVKPVTNGTGLSPIMAAFPYLPARIPASQTSILSTAEYHDFKYANPQASSVPLSPTEQQLFTAEPPSRAPSQRGWQAGSGVHPPRQIADNYPRVPISQSRTSEIDELRRDGGTYRHAFRRSQRRPA